MEIITTKDALRKCVRSWHEHGLKVGVVLTMGSLHEGHLSLIDAITKECDRCIVTCFVNPVQFNDPSDFKHYPRHIERDAQLLRDNGKVDVFYTPRVEDMYSPGFITKIDVGAIGRKLCGQDREGHFNGVALVVVKLLMQTQADIAAFGAKDYQQLCILRHVIRDLDLDIPILAVPIWRHKDGLAYSSRNERLSPQQRKKAVSIPRILKDTFGQLKSGRSVPEAIKAGKAQLEEKGFNVHYLTLCDGETLEEIPELRPDGRLFVAATLGHVRLIDNISMKEAEKLPS